MNITNRQTGVYPSKGELETALAGIRQSPRGAGRLELIVARPAEGQRVVFEEAEIHLEAGLLGDTWLARGSRSTTDGQANPAAQVTVMNARVARAVAGERDHWPLAGDQLYVDLDLSEENLAPGDRLVIGEVVLEVSALPHTGCAKFTERFGHDAIQFVNCREGRALRLRGMNTRVLQAGKIKVGDVVSVERPSRLADSQRG